MIRTARTRLGGEDSFLTECGRVQVFSKSYCPHCKNTKQLLTGLPPRPYPPLSYLRLPHSPLSRQSRALKGGSQAGA